MKHGSVTQCSASAVLLDHRMLICYTAIVLLLLMSGN